MKALLIGGPEEKDGTWVEVRDGTQHYQITVHDPERGEYLLMKYYRLEKMFVDLQIIEFFVFQDLTAIQAITRLFENYIGEFPALPELEITDILTGEKHIIDVDKLPT